MAVNLRKDSVRELAPEHILTEGQAAELYSAGHKPAAPAGVQGDIKENNADIVHEDTHKAEERRKRNRRLVLYKAGVSLFVIAACSLLISYAFGWYAGGLSAAVMLAWCAPMIGSGLK